AEPAVPVGSFDVIVHARQKTLEAVRGELSALDGRATVLVDALDEAAAGEALGIPAHLSSPARRGDVAIPARTRPDPALGRPMRNDALLRELGADRVLDLEQDASTREDIAAMVRAQLLAAPESPYHDAPVEEIADLSASLTSPNFLFAHATARWLSGL